MAEIARSSKEEFNDLVKAYYDADPNRYKIRLAATLRQLNYTDIIPDLLNIKAYESLADQFICALILVEFNQEAGGKFLLECHEKDPKNNSLENFAYYMNEIYEEVCCEVAAKYYKIFTQRQLAEKMAAEQA